MLLPGVKVIPGLPTMSFWHWIVAIFILATVHETCHGIFARLNNVKLKSLVKKVLTNQIYGLLNRFYEPLKLIDLFLKSIQSRDAMEQGNTSLYKIPEKLFEFLTNEKNENENKKNE